MSEPKPRGHLIASTIFFALILIVATFFHEWTTAVIALFAYCYFIDKI